MRYWQSVAVGLGLLGVSLGGADDPNPGKARARPRETKPAAPDAEAAEGRLSMTPAIACSKIEPDGRYVPLDEPALTKDDKLLLYYEPKNYKLERVDGAYQIHLSQDVRVRRRGKKEVLWSKDHMVDYQGKSRQRPGLIFMTNTIAIKALTPGEYDLDIILHDELAKGPPAVQVFRFTVKPSPPPTPANVAREKAKEKGQPSEPEVADDGP
jgi:hypothetical protein